MKTVVQMTNIWLRAISLVLVLGLGLAGTGCASSPKLVFHSFGFDVLADSPDAQLLDYRYGTSKQPGARPPEWALRDGMVRQQAGITGEMILGDSLYVKWRIKSTGEVLEETVDLKSRLPRDITDHKVYFVIQGREIHVYLVSPVLRPAAFPIVGPKEYRYYKVYQIYPASTFNK